MRTIDYDIVARRLTTDTWLFDPDTDQWIGDGHLVEETTLNPNQIVSVDDAGDQVITHFDVFGRMIRRDLPTGDYIENVYEDLGRLVRTISTAPTPSGVETRVTDLNNFYQPLITSVEVAGVPTVVAAFSYDALGRPESASNAEGYAVRTTYDGFGRVATTTDSYSGIDGETVTLGYDPVGRLVERHSTVPGAATQTTTFEYDWLGRLVTRTRPGNQVESFSYLDPAGLLGTYTDAAGVLHTSVYAPGTFDLEAVVSALDTSSHTVAFEYDQLGRLVAAETDAGTGSGLGEERTEFRYDSVGSVLSEHDLAFATTPHAISRFVDARRYELTYGDDANQAVLGYDLDPIGRLARVERVGPPVPAIDFVYDGLGGAVELHRSSGLSSEFEYDDLGRLLRATDHFGGADVATRRWEMGLDGAPRLRSLETAAGASLGSVFQVDEAGRVSAENHGVGDLSAVFVPTTADRITANGAVESHVGLGQEWRSYVYDARNNWLARQAASPELVTEPGLNDSDGYLDFAGEALIYDSRGAVVAKGGTTFQRDLLGRVVGVSDGTGTTQLRYDALGRMVRLTAPDGSETRFAYDGSNRVMQRDDAGLKVIAHTGLDTYAWIEDLEGTHQFVHQGVDGSVRLLSDDTGELLRLFDYTAFGERSVFDAAGAALQPSDAMTMLGFQGHPTLGDFVHMRARMYDPAMGRFLSQDPLGLVDGSNLYAFVGNRALTHVDPFGTKGRQVSESPWARWPMDYEKLPPNGGVYGMPSWSDRVRYLTKPETLGGDQLIHMTKFYVHFLPPGQAKRDLTRIALGPVQPGLVKSLVIDPIVHAYIVGGTVAQAIGVTDRDFHAEYVRNCGSTDDRCTLDNLSLGAAAAGPIARAPGLAKKGWTLAKGLRRGGRPATSGVDDIADGIGTGKRGGGARGDGDGGGGGGGGGRATGGGGKPECFVAGTLVETEHGPVPIEDIKVGDRVLSRVEFVPATDWMPVQEDGHPELVDGAPIPTLEDEVSVIDLDDKRIWTERLADIDYPTLILFGERVFELSFDDDGRPVIRATGGILRLVEVIEPE